MRKTRLLICGGTGFIGQNLVRHYAALPAYDVHATHFSRPPVPIAGVSWHFADLRDAQDVTRVVAGAEIVIQAAATTSGVRDIVQTPYLHVTDNAVMNAYLLRAAHEQRVRHFVFFSCSVMYPSAEQPLTEDAVREEAIAPRYFAAAHTKLYVERMCAFFASLGTTRFTALRHSNIYGPHDKFDLGRSHVCGATITKVLTASGETISVWGDGREARDLLYVDDLRDCVVAALEHQRAPFALYNCGSGTALSVNDLVAAVMDGAGKRLRIVHDLTQPTIPVSLCLDSSRAARELGWRPRVCLSEGLARTIAWWRSQMPHPMSSVSPR